MLLVAYSRDGMASSCRLIGESAACCLAGRHIGLAATSMWQCEHLRTAWHADVPDGAYAVLQGWQAEYEAARLHRQPEASASI